MRVVFNCFSGYGTLGWRRWMKIGGSVWNVEVEWMINVTLLFGRLRYPFFRYGNTRLKSSQMLCILVNLHMSTKSTAICKVTGTARCGAWDCSRPNNLARHGGKNKGSGINVGKGMN
jgi:hypothetical protein